MTLHRFRLVPVRSPLLRESRFLSVPAGTEMFQFPAFPALSRCQETNPGRFPDLGDLRIIAYLAAPRSFSQLCHVLRRLWTPRHPPCTLGSLTTLFLYFVVIATLANSLCFQRTARLPSRRDRVRRLEIVPRAREAGLARATLFELVEATGFEPTTAWLQTRCSTN